MPPRCSGGTAPSSMNCIDLSAGSSRDSTGLAAWRSSHSAASASVPSASSTCVAPCARIPRDKAVAPSLAAAGDAASISIRSTASVSAGNRVAVSPARAASRTKSRNVRSSNSQAAAPASRAIRAAPTAASSVGNAARRLAVAPGRSMSANSMPAKTASVPSLPTSKSTRSPLRAYSATAYPEESFRTPGCWRRAAPAA